LDTELNIPLKLNATLTSWVTFNLEDFPPADRTDGWRTHAKCKGEPLSLFFENTRAVNSSIKELCGSCPVRVECLWSALPKTTMGLWAGTTHAMRARIRRKLRESGIEPPKHPSVDFALGCVSDACRCDSCRRAYYRRLQNERQVEAS